MKQAVLVVSFGTTFPDTRAKNIDAVLRRVEAVCPELPVYEAWSSSMIRKALQKRGESVDDVPTAAARMAADGVRDVLVLPTHLLYGDEYDKICAQMDEAAGQFQRVSIAAPLLASDDDLRAVLKAVWDGVPTTPDEALVLMGHGTPHFCNTIYAAMDYHAKAMGLPRVFVGTVEAFPDLNTLIQAVRDSGCTQAALTPLMLVAGDHANHDMASEEPDSWKSRFEQAGIPCRAVIRGLGEYPAILDLYEAHLRKIM